MELVWGSLLTRRRKRAPRVPAGLRIYAIGDVHGRADLLAGLFAVVDADVTARPTSQVVEVLVGDYIDRGPQSRDVLDLLIRRRERHRTICLKGNHETYLAEFLRNPTILTQWRSYGALETLVSYGLTPSIKPDEHEQRELAAALDRVLPESHRRFLAALKPSFTCGDYFFVHAGVRPGVPLAEQQEQDLLWIRDDFLLHEDSFDKIIIHGHTAVTEPDIRPNRINIDTGAYASGRLTCLALEGEHLSFI